MDDGDVAPPHDHLVLVEDKWPILDRGRGSLGQKHPTLTGIYEVTVMKITGARGACRQKSFADTSGGSSYRQNSPNCRRTPPAKAPPRILHRPHTRGVRSHETEQQKGRKGCQMGQLAGRCARAWMPCHQTQLLGRPHTPRPILWGHQTPWPKSQAVEPTKSS